MVVMVVCMTDRPFSGDLIMPDTKVDMELIEIFAQVVTQSQLFAFCWINKGFITNHRNVLNHIIYSHFLRQRIIG